MSPLQKDLKIETLRGLACCLLVFNHLIGKPLESGLRLPDDNIFYHINMLLENLRMPLFAFIAGFIFSHKGIRSGSELDFVKGKALRLLLPLAVVGPIFLFIQANSGVSNLKVGADSGTYYLSVLWMSRFHFWFLQSMFLVFVFYAVLNQVDKCRSHCLEVGFVVGILALMLLPIDYHLFSFSGFLYLLPYFSFGGILNKYKMQSEGIAFSFAVAVLLISFAIKALLIYNDVYFDRNNFVSIFLSIAFCFSFYRLGLVSHVASYVGHYSFAIFLYHVFFLVLARLFSNKFGLDVHSSILIGFVFGVGGPIILQKIVKNNKWLAFVFIGAKIRKGN